MLGFRYLLSLLFGWLSFPMAQGAVGENTADSQAIEVIIAADSHQNKLAIIDFGEQLHQIIDTSQTPELQVFQQVNKVEHPNATTYAPKLLYYNIGNAIELHLTTTSIIFPFHCFT